LKYFCGSSAPIWKYELNLLLEQGSKDDLGDINTWTAAETVARSKLWARARVPEVSFTAQGLLVLQIQSTFVKKLKPSDWAEMIEGGDQEAAVEFFHFLCGTQVLYKQ
jgi:hypothetical protein